MSLAALQMDARRDSRDGDGNGRSGACPEELAARASRRRQLHAGLQPAGGLILQQAKKKAGTKTTRAAFAAAWKSRARSLPT